MRRRPPRSTQSRSSAASDVYKRQRSAVAAWLEDDALQGHLHVAPGLVGRLDEELSFEDALLDLLVDREDDLHARLVDGHDLDRDARHVRLRLRDREARGLRIVVDEHDVCLLYTS